MSQPAYFRAGLCWRVWLTAVGTLAAAAQPLAEENVSVRVVSMPCVEAFESQDADYRESVLPAANRNRLAIEAGHVDYWRKWVGLDGDVIGMNSFGASAPGGDLFEYYGFTIDKVVQAAKSLGKDQG